MIEGELQEQVAPIAQAIAAAGGRAFVVGGFVRDRLLGRASKDLDIEVHGLDRDVLAELLGRFGGVLSFGRSFDVFQVKGLAADFGLARTTVSGDGPSPVATVGTEWGERFAAAARFRDLTINSMGVDLVTGDLLDPFSGRADLRAKRLRATDPETFGQDPLRGLRVAQFAARFEMVLDSQLVALCAALDLSDLPGERLGLEFDKLLLQARAPSVGLEVLRTTGLVRAFPELAALDGVPQDPKWHPEGDVWVHTCQVIDVAASLRREDGEDLPLMYGALCHDLGKPGTTEASGGRIRSLGHDRAGEAPTREFLGRLRKPTKLVEQVVLLVRHHLAPALLTQAGAGPRAYRRLARRLSQAQVSTALLERVARADHWGRMADGIRANDYAAGDAFLAEVEKLDIPDDGPRDVVLGRHLIARGMQPGPAISEMLDHCRAIQDEMGWDDADRILDRAFASNACGRDGDD